MEPDISAVPMAAFITIDPLTVITLLLLGFFGGLMSGVIGSGGAFILTPGMMNLGVDGTVAVASNMAHKFPKALVGAWKRHELGHVDIKLGLVMASSAIVGVQMGIQVQKIILAAWGKGGSDLYISLAFVLVLCSVGAYTLADARKAMRIGAEDTSSVLAEKIKSIIVLPMMNFKTAESRVSFWVCMPLGFATGFLAATIAVGGFIGVPAMIYVIGAPSLVASGTELVIAFVMGIAGAFTWALAGFVDLRLTVLLLAGSLIGVQVGALGTSYMKPYMIKTITGVVMLLAGISRIVLIPRYLTDLNVMSLRLEVYEGLSVTSFIVLYGTLLVAGFLIIRIILRGKTDFSRDGRSRAKAPSTKVP